LDLEGCFSLIDLPDSIFNMSTLVRVERSILSLNVVNSKVDKLRKELNLKGSSELHGGDDDLWSQIAELEKTPCHELLINGLDNVKGLEGVEHAKLSNNLNLSWLNLVWDHGDGSPVEHADTLVLERLVPPRSLQHLGLVGYMSIDLPRWILDIPSYLPHITTIFLSGLKRCNHLPPLGQLPNLRALALKEMPNVKSVGREFYGDYGRCQKLRMIVLESMDNMEEWWTTRSSREDGEFLIPNLHLLAAFDCPKLKFLPYPPRSLLWMVGYSDHVLPEHGFGSLSSTTTPFFLGIGGASLSSEVWPRIQYLSSIEGFVLHTLTGLRTLPEAIRCFRSLRGLSIMSCADLETLPEWLGNFTSLREIIIYGCLKLSSLPESIRRLTELKTLRIFNCPALLEKCQGEDSYKIAHIPRVVFR
jgi:aquaporin TIP